MNNNVNADQATLDNAFDKMIILLGESYIDRCGMPKVADIVKEGGVEYEKGKVYGAHIQAVQRLLIDEFKVMGLNLVTEIEKHNEKFEIGKFSKYENDIVVNKIGNLGFFVDKVIDYKEGNK